jgi:hypothetical protein
MTPGWFARIVLYLRMKRATSGVGVLVITTPLLLAPLLCSLTVVQCPRDSYHREQP